MLEERDLQAIAKMISDSEARTAEKISASEARTAEKISASEARMMALMEAYFEPKFSLLADGQKLIREKMLPAEAWDETEERLDVLEVVVKRHSKEIQNLKRAQ